MSLKGRLKDFFFHAGKSPEGKIPFTVSLGYLFGPLLIVIKKCIQSIIVVLSKCNKAKRLKSSSSSGEKKESNYDLL